MALPRGAFEHRRAQRAIPRTGEAGCRKAAASAACTGQGSGRMENGNWKLEKGKRKTPPFIPQNSGMGRRCKKQKREDPDRVGTVGHPETFSELE